MENENTKCEQLQDQVYTWQGMYNIAANRALHATSEIERLRQELERVNKPQAVTLEDLKIISIEDMAAYLLIKERLEQESKVLSMIISWLDDHNVSDVGIDCPDWCQCAYDNPCGFQLGECARQKIAKEAAHDR